MTTSECIIYQSLVDADKSPLQQVSNLTLSGFITIDAFLNTDKGKLYGTFVKSGSQYVLSLYKDAARAQLVADTAPSRLLAQAIVRQQNQSGIEGTVYFQQYQADDSNINVVCFLTTDGDLRFDNLNSVSTFDPVYGFAGYHLQGFDEARRTVIGRQKANIFNPSYLDSRNLQGVTGGYDLSRCLNFYESLREAVGYYVLSLILQGQYVEPGSVFDVRCKEAWKMARGCFDGADLTFDFGQTRVEQTERSNRTRKLSRA